MATQTTHLHLKKPELSDVADISDINGNMDIIDSEIYDLKQNFPSVPLPISKGGTNATTAAAARTQLGVASVMITVNMGTITSLPVTKTATGITSDMKVCGWEIDNPTAFASNLTVTTANGSVTLSGEKRGSADSKVVLRFTNNKDVTAS